MLLSILLLFSQNSPDKTFWPIVSDAYIVLDPVQAKYPGNEHIKPCGPHGPTDGTHACYDPNARYVINHIYESKNSCEESERVSCTSYLKFWAPIGKPVFEDKTETK